MVNIILYLFIIGLLIMPINNIAQEDGSSSNSPEIYSNLNIFEQIFNNFSSLIGIPKIKLQTKVHEQRVLIIDYEESFNAAKEALVKYKLYVECIDLSYRAPLPYLTLIVDNSDAKEINAAYTEYVNSLIDYITVSREKCERPTISEIAKYKEEVSFGHL